jgi:hypothetical protein
MWPPSTASDTTAPRPPASGLSPLPVTRLRCIVHVVAMHVLELVGCSADLRGVEALALFRVADVLVLDPRDALPGDGDLPRSHGVPPDAVLASDDRGSARRHVPDMDPAAARIGGACAVDSRGEIGAPDFSAVVRMACAAPVYAARRRIARRSLARRSLFTIRSLSRRRQIFVSNSANFWCYEAAAARCQVSQPSTQASTNRSAATGSNCVPAPSATSANASSCVRARR